ncbi:GNAT family N-acetyltransferase [Jejuia spongiicola]|uniref:GNAT family N-acetyltransferase n=1 Tax=Jejuia spongiicola TaxID=2942207 RepID=A0ABT0QD87_9FLAO|nr:MULTISPECIES: GNAT family N-acetyltransferase [Flavobacteriaceae]MCL6294214.1 GNAT family N-acetyltransferase [Jejuia spongiicola]PIA79575.1 GNAT family N-acetyltransferase [Gaetbulibacter sp. 4G1]
MSFLFKIIDKQNINSIIPLVQKLNGNKDTDAVLKQRFSEMITQNYECAGIFDNEKLIGICGLWFCTRHYSGKSVEPDHVYIDDTYRGKGLGKQFFEWIYNYVRLKGCESIELNTYVSNPPSHKFYYNEGFKILGYHFFKKL